MAIGDIGTYCQAAGDLSRTCQLAGAYTVGFKEIVTSGRGLIILVTIFILILIILIAFGWVSELTKRLS